MTDRDKAIDALDDLEKVFGEGLTPHGWEMFDTIRQALTPQSSADLGEIRTALANAINGEDGALSMGMHLWEHRFTLKQMLDQQGDTMPKPIQYSDGSPSREYEEHPSPLTALRARVEGMRKPMVKGYGFGSNAENKNSHAKTHNAAIDSVLRTIDEVIREGK